MIDVGKLIAAVQRRRPLWAYRQRALPATQRKITLKLWAEVAAECDSEIHIVNAKWKTIKERFKVHYKRMGKICGVEEPKGHRWMWCKHLLFLLDSSGEWPENDELDESFNLENFEQGTDRSEVYTSGTIPLKMPLRKHSSEAKTKFELEREKKQLLEEQISTEKTEYMNVDIEKLINAVKQHPCIWDMAHPKHRNQRFKLQFWKQVAAECNFKIDIAKYKWYQLVNTFRFNQNMWEENSEECDWIWYKHLLFLLNSSECMTTNHANHSVVIELSDSDTYDSEDSEQETNLLELSMKMSSRKHSNEEDTIFELAEEKENTEIVNVEKLITEVQQREALWNMKHPKNQDVHVKQTLWEEVAAACGVKSNDVKFKWRVLKDNFIICHKKNDKSGSTKSERADWLWYKHLLFLVDSLEDMQMSNNLLNFPMEVEIDEFLTSKLEDLQQGGSNEENMIFDLGTEAGQPETKTPPECFTQFIDEEISKEETRIIVSGQHYNEEDTLLEWARGVKEYTEIENIDVEKLVAEVQQREAIWNTKDPNFQNVHVKQKLWEEVATACGVKSNDVKFKWRVLKDNFIICHKKNDKSGSTKLERADWLWYKHLLFLVDSLEDMQMSNNLLNFPMEVDIDEFLTSNSEDLQQGGSNEENMIFDLGTEADQPETKPLPECFTQLIDEEITKEETRIIVSGQHCNEEDTLLEWARGVKEYTKIGNIDVEKLVAEVQQREAIWNTKDPNFQNVHVKQKLWDEVAAACGVNSNEVKYKWKVLLDNFHISRKKKERRGNAALGEQDWIWYKYLSFLYESSKDMQMSKNGFKAPVVVKLEESTTCSSKDSQQETDMPSTNIRPHTPPASHINETHISKEKNDDLLYFLGTLRQPMSQLTLQKQLLLRIKFDELIYQSLYEIDQ